MILEIHALILLITVTESMLLFLGMVYQSGRRHNEPEHRQGEPGLVYVTRLLVWFNIGAVMMFWEVLSEVPALLKWLLLPKSGDDA